MAYIYRDSVGKAIQFGVSGVIPTSADITRGDVVTPVTLIGSVAQVPYSVTRTDGRFTLKWNYTVDGDAYTKTEIHEVVTPVFSRDELIAWDSDFTLLEEEKTDRLERIIRAVIEHFTGQEFGYKRSNVSVRSSGGIRLSLPQRLVEPVTVNGVAAASFETSNDGWILGFRSATSWLDDLPAFPYGSETMWSDPLYGRRWFSEGYHAVDGYFGYHSIPDDIQLAALILAGTYGCDEDSWRERYIETIRAGDWAIAFNSQAYSGTGNATVDKILQKYTLNKMVIL